MQWGGALPRGNKTAPQGAPLRGTTNSNLPRQYRVVSHGSPRGRFGSVRRSPTELPRKVHYIGQFHPIELGLVLFVQSVIDAN